MSAGTVEQEDAIVQGGDINVESVELFSSQHTDPFRLDDIWMDISIFENIESSFIEGQITIMETQDLLTSIPILGNEKIVIKFITPSAFETRTVVGQLVNISQRHQISQGQQIYILDFISPEFIKNQKIQFSKSYNGTLISDMVEDIYSQFFQGVSGKPLYTVPTLHQTSRVVPTMSPIRAIDWLSQWAVSPEYRTGASYIFFEYSTGYFFGPLESLMDGNDAGAITYKRNIVHAQKGASRDVYENFHTLEDFKVISPDYTKAITQGAFSSRTVTRDIVLRTPTELTFDYFQTYPELTHLESSEENTMLHNDIGLGRNYDSFVQYESDHYNTFTNQSSFRTSAISGTRRSQLAQMFALKVSITVPGDSNRTVGEVVTLEIPSASPALVEDSGALDKYLSGRYLITALRHSISRVGDDKPTHKLNMEVCKDSYKTPLPEHTIRHWE